MGRALTSPFGYGYGILASLARRQRDGFSSYGRLLPRAKPESKTLITEGGVKQRVPAYRKEERQQMGWGLGKIPKWAPWLSPEFFPPMFLCVKSNRAAWVSVR